MVSDPDVAAAIESLTRWEIGGRQIVVRLTDDLSASPVEVWTATLQRPISGGSLPLDVMAELKLALESEGVPPPFLLDTRRGYTEWGASGVSEVVELVVGWGLAGVVGNATYDALRAAVTRLARSHRDEKSYGPRRPLDRQEAEERGRLAVRSAFHLSFEDVDRLAPIALEQGAHGWLVRYALDDDRYEVELLEDDGLVSVARVGWMSGQ